MRSSRSSELGSGRLGRSVPVGAALVVAFALVGAVDASAGQPAGGASVASDDLLDRPAHGTRALDRLGSDLAEAASVNGLAPGELRRVLRTDPTAWLDTDGQMYYVEPTVDASGRSAASDGSGQAAQDGSRQAAPAAAATNTAQAAAQPTADAAAFQLHSRAESRRVIYLDFTGHVVSGTAWNDAVGMDPWNVPAYDTDGDPSSFSEAERDVVRAVWARVAEDYAAMDVDVTTEEPSPGDISRDGADDLDFGTRLLIDPTSDYQGQCGCGGVAYVGVFDRTSNHGYYQPALAFTQGVGTGAKNLGEVAAHEVGHNLGLSHDGTTDGSNYYAGHGDWAPIMGVGYNKPITQWSIGEYADANNQEDDYAVMADNGAAVATDDHADDSGSATPLAVGTEATGVIGTRADLDMFAVEVTDGTLTVSAQAAAVEPDLDIRLQLLNAAGEVLATSDPPSSGPDGMSASLSQSVTSGTYLITVDGTGYGNPLSTGYSDYASRGAFTVLATQ